MHPLELFQLRRLAILIVGKDVEQLELSYDASWNTKWHYHFGKQFGSFFIKLIINPYNLATMPLDIYLKAMKT